MRVLRRDCLLGGRGLFGGGHVATAAASRDEEAEVALEQRAGVDAAAVGIQFNQLPETLGEEGRSG